MASDKTVTAGSRMSLLEGSVPATLLKFSFPFMLSTLLQTLYSTTDTIIVGQFLGSRGLSAVSNGAQLMQLIYLACIGASMAGQILIAQAKGAGNQEKVQKVVSSLFVLEIILSLIMTAVSLIFAKTLLRLLHTPEEAVPQAYYYIVICGLGIIFTGLYNMYSAVLRGLGDSIHPLIFVAVAVGLNIILDILFVAVFHWQVAGAALATVIGQAVSVIFSIVYLTKHSRDYGIDFGIRQQKTDAETQTAIIKMAVPMAIQSAAIHFSFLFVTSMINTQGLAVSAAFAVFGKLEMLPGIITQGLGLGTSSMIGQNFGAHKNDRVKSTVHYCMLFTTVIQLLFGAFFGLFPQLSYRLFTQDETVLAYASLGTAIILMQIPARCVMGACNSLISAIGYVKLSFIIAVVDAFLGRVLICWLLGSALHLGTTGYFIGYGSGTYVTAIMALVYFLSGRWEKRKVLV
ncbi:MAG: MATE family efflux transporter [Lachnospiraceae bacterium]|nr:MATE family efflux transporter [Lachnospiraceae bacterium]